MSNQGRQAGADDIEVTEEMMQAGVEVLWNSGALDIQTDADREIVWKIYRAMVLAADARCLACLK